jgi:transposase
VRAQATALACSLPGDTGTPLARWSAAEIGRYLVALRLVVSIAASTVARWLAQERLKPWRYHTWQHVLNPQAFLERARPVLTLYQQASALLKELVWVVCVDEKTSIQAREGELAPKPVLAEQPMQVAPRYKRHGALQLFAALSVADGRTYAQCCLHKRFLDFQAFLLGVVIPQALQRSMRTLILILDNSSTHAPKQLEAWLEEQANLHQWSLRIKVFWLPKNASWLDQIEIWFSILQRKLLQPNHFRSLQDLERGILAFVEHYNQTAKSIHWSYTIEKLELKLGLNL